MITAPDQAARLAAVDETRSVIVQAPAGSGKTSLLVTRYLRLLAGAQRPEEILAITFTRKAAGEMRERILGALAAGEAIAQGALQRASQQGWNLTDQPHRLKIQTIDSFAMSLLRQLPLASEFDPNVALLEHAERHYALAAQRLFARLHNDDPLAPYIADFLAWLDNDFHKAQRLLVDMLGRRDQWLDVVGEIVATHQSDPELVRESLTRGIHDLHHTVVEALETQLTSSQLAQMAELVETAAAHLDQQLPEGSARYRLAGEIFTTQRDQLRKSLTKTQGFPPHEAAHKDRGRAFLQQAADAEAYLAHLRHLPDANLPTRAMQRLVDVCVTLTLAVMELGQLFAQDRVADFTQLTLSARTALGKDDAPTELALALDYRIKHILVDEFQDTSVAQFQLFEQLLRGWQADDGNSFFAVGDPMQSVYRFRDAEVGLFFQAWHHGIGDLRLQQVRLTANFRANADLVSWGNEVFAGVFGQAEDPLLGQVAHMPAVATRPSANRRAVYGYTCIDDNEAIALMVKTIAQLQRAEPHARIAVLVRSRNHLRELLPALRGAGISWRATDIEPLPDKPVVKDLLALARVIANPWDRLSWFAVLRAPWVGLSLRDLEAFAHCNDFAAAISDPPNALSPDAHTRVARFAQALAKGHRLHHEAPPRRVLETVWLSAGGADAYASDADIDCAERLLELIDAQGSRDLDPERLAEAAQNLYANDASTAQLEILTIHKAKGLEFDHVLLPFLDRQPRRPDAPLLRWRPQGHGLLLGVKDLDGVYDWLAREDRAREHHELKRLLYVACTRARESLHLYGVAQEHRQGNSGSLLSLFPEGYGTQSVAQAPDSQQQTQLHPAAPDEQLAGADPLPVVQADMFMGRTLHRLRSNYRWQPPQTVSRAVSTSAPATIVASDDIGGDWQVALGTIMHNAMRTLAGRHPLPIADVFIDEHRARWRKSLAALAVDDADHARVIAEVAKQLHSVLADSTGRWLLAQHTDAQCEAPLTGLDPAMKLANVFLDRMFVDERGSRWIVDYKSTIFSDTGTSTAIAAEVARYRPQLARYGRFAAAIYPEPIRLALYFTAIPRLEELALDEALAQSPLQTDKELR